MTNQEIFELMDRFERGSIRTMRLSTGGISLELSKDAPLSGAPAQASASPAAEAPAQRQAAPARTPGCVIAAPMAGVFYAASAPGATPFVAVGDRVKQGDIVCLMEAMKMISEIPAPCDCIITEIYGENGKLVGFDEPLFGYTAC